MKKILGIIILAGALFMTSNLGTVQAQQGDTIYHGGWGCPWGGPHNPGPRGGWGGCC